MEDIFAKADQAIEAKYGDQAGDAAPSGQASEQSPNASDQAPGGQESKGLSESEAKAILDLSKVEKFKLGGKEMTLKDLESQMMMQSDYQRKTQEIAELRRAAEYSMHWEADMPKLLDDPSLASEFYRAYPKSYHPLIERISRFGESSEPASESDAPTQSQLVKRLVEDAVGPIREELDQYKTEAAVKQLDGVFLEMKGKYPSAEEEFVLSRLETLRGQGVGIDKSKIEEVFKHFHARDEKLKADHLQEQLNKQKQANAKAKDVPSGGGIPGQAPQKFKLNSEKDWSDLEKRFEQHLRTQ